MGGEVGFLSEVRERGFAFLGEYCPELPTSDILSHFGVPVALGATGAAAHELRPIQLSEASPNTYSGNFGVGPFPMHTDLAHWRIPPRYILLRCAIGFEDVTTLITDGFALIRKMGEVHATRTIMKPRRPIAGGLQLLHLFQKARCGSWRIRWDEIFLRPASEAGQYGVEIFQRKLLEAGTEVVCLKNRGDTLVFDNWKMIHGRSAVPPHCYTRMIDRAYLGELL